MSNIRNDLTYINHKANSDPAGLVAAAEARYHGIVAGIAHRALPWGWYRPAWQRLIFRLIFFGCI